MSDNKKPKPTETEVLETPRSGAASEALPAGSESAAPGEGGAGIPSSDELAGLKAKAAKADEHWDRLLRTRADFDNFKKRAARDRQEAIRFANESLLSKLIPVLDHFDAALAAAGEGGGGNGESFRTGVAMIYNQLRSVLGEAGLEEIDASGRPFDPNVHEAVSQEESNTVPEGQVIRQLRKGYRLRERLLRPATVVVARKPAA
jgi:molecular chaperone GrpE